MRPMTRPSAAVTSTRFRCTIGRSDSPTQRINHPNSAPTTPMANAQPMVASVGGTAGGTEGSASEKLPSPVQLSRPTKTSAPRPEASSRAAPPGSASVPQFVGDRSRIEEQIIGTYAMVASCVRRPPSAEGIQPSEVSRLVRKPNGVTCCRGTLGFPSGVLR